MALRLLIEARDLSQEVGCALAQAAIACLLGQTHLIAGHHEQAEQELGLALSLARGLGDLRLETQALLGLGVTRVRLGRLTEAVECVRRALQIAATSDQNLNRPLAFEALSTVVPSEPEPENAVGPLRQSCDLLHALGLQVHETRSLALLAQAHLAEGDAAVARGALERTSERAAMIERRRPAPVIGRGPA